MQQTRLDRWLRERFVYETHIYSMRPATEVPRRVQTEELPEAPGRQYRMRYISRRNGDADALIAQLKADNQMFTTRVLDRSTWYAPFLAPQGKSFTWFVIWSVVTVVSVLSVTRWLMQAWNNENVRSKIFEALEVLKG